MKRRKDLVWAGSLFIACAGSLFLTLSFGGWTGHFSFLLIVVSGAASLFLFASLLFRSIQQSLWDGRRLMSLGLLLVALLTLYFDPVALVVEKMKADRVFSGTCEHTVTFVQLVLRDDGSSEYEPGSFLDRNWTTGHWSRSGDTIAVWTSSEMTRPRLLLIQSNGLNELDADPFGHHHGFAGSTVELRSMETPQ
jgi:hypothetical protein